MKLNKKQFENYVKKITKILVEKMDPKLAEKMIKGKAPLPKCPSCNKTLKFDMMKVLRCYNNKCDEFGLTYRGDQPIDNRKDSVDSFEITTLKNLSSEIKISANIIGSKGSEIDVVKANKLLKKVHTELDKIRAGIF